MTDRKPAPAQRVQHDALVDPHTGLTRCCAVDPRVAGLEGGFTLDAACVTCKAEVVEP